MTDALPTNYFALFGIPVSYDVDLDMIQHRYRELQKAVHPDRYSSASDQERRMSMQQASLINQALHTLKHPVERAMYLMQLKDSQFSMDNQTTVDTGFLMQQLEMREKLEAIRSYQDPVTELETMSAQVKAAIQTFAGEFGGAYQADDIERAKEALRKLQFLHKAGAEIAELIASIEDELM